MSQNQDFPYANTGPRDEIKSVGVQEDTGVHPDAQRTTYVRDYQGEEPTLQGYGTTFKSGLLTTAQITDDTFQYTKTSGAEPFTDPRDPTYEQANTTYMTLGKTQAIDDDRKNTIRKGAGPIQGATTMNKSYRDKGFARNPQIDANQLYTNNFDQRARPAEVDNHVDQTQTQVDYKGHWLPEGQEKEFKKLAPKPRKGLNKKSEYTGKYKKPGYRNLGLQTTASRGLNYGNRFARKPAIPQSETMYARDYQGHQQRVMNALKQFRK